MDGFVKHSPSKHSSKRKLDGDKEELSMMQQEEYQSLKPSSNFRSTTDLMSSCWVCTCTLKLPPPQLCMYSTHCHPHLTVPVCVLCSETLLYVESDACWGCAKDDDALLLCCSDCDKEFCTTCVGFAIGNSEAVQTLIDSDDDWKCLSCQPPEHLRRVMQSLLEQQDEDAGNTTSPRTFDAVIHELQVVEEERNHCLEALDMELEHLRLISNELGGTQNCEETVLEEWSYWKQMQLDHEKRLLDKVSSLQDELAVTHKVKDIAALYKDLGLYSKRRSSEVPNDEFTDDDAETEVEPDYVRLAGKAICRREKEERQQRLDKSPMTILDKAIYKRDDLFSDVEELASEDEDDLPNSEEKGWRMSNGFRTNRMTASPSDIQEAWQLENERLDSINRARPKTAFSSADDKDAMQLEEHQIAGGSVRKDVYRVAVARSKKRQRVHTPTEGTSVEDGLSMMLPKQKHQLSCADDLEEGPPSYQANAPALPQGARAGLKSREPNGRRSQGVNEPLSSQVNEPALSQNSAASMDKAGTAEESQSRIIVASPIIHGKKRRIALTGSLVLCRKGRDKVRTVAVADELAVLLKPHQREGIVNMWQNAFSDMERHLNGNLSEVGGCILAHNMGLGKTLSAIALIHTVLTAKSMPVVKETGKPMVDAVLVVAPTNVIFNWENEFEKWTGHLKPPLVIDSIDKYNKTSYVKAVHRWRDTGGVLLVTERKLSNLFKEGIQLQPDLLVCDEAHAMLKNSSCKTFQALSSITTPRKILLTGSPFQNNLLEYFRMISFIRPNVFPEAASESEFDAHYVKPIQEGESSDATAEQVWAHVSKAKQIHDIVEPFVHRKDASVLREVLPPLQQVVLHVRQSRPQCRLYRKYERRRHKAENGKNFFRTYHDTRLLHNHPGCLVTAADKNQRKVAKSDDAVPKDEWWQTVMKPGDEAQLLEVCSGYKMILLLHILVASVKQNDKILIFSESLQTLDYVERMLALKDWCEHVPTLASSDTADPIGGWKRDQDYLRIDGSTNSEDRGCLVDRFNSTLYEGVANSVKAFLISTMAGGVGINLTAANRVVLLDSHFNPSVTTQALFRSYRYGQVKPVYVYRLLTEGSIEQKIYNRSVVKNGLALRVIDDKSFVRMFTKSELADLTENLMWAQCDSCGRWRVLLEELKDDLPEQWFCKDNSDPQNNSCAHPERSPAWYEKVIHGMATVSESPLKGTSSGEADSSLSENETQALVAKDSVLQELLEIKQKNSKVISRFTFHDVLLASSKDTDEELESARKAAEFARKADANVAKNLESTFAVEPQDMFTHATKAASATASVMPAANADANKVSEPRNLTSGKVGTKLKAGGQTKKEVLGDSLICNGTVKEAVEKGNSKDADLNEKADSVGEKVATTPSMSAGPQGKSAKSKPDLSAPQRDVHSRKDLSALQAVVATSKSRPLQDLASKAASTNKRHDGATMQESMSDNSISSDDAPLFKKQLLRRTESWSDDSLFADDNVSSKNTKPRPRLSLSKAASSNHPKSESRMTPQKRSPKKRSSAGNAGKQATAKRRGRSEPIRAIPANVEVVDLCDSDDDSSKLEPL
ncbi:hypothetical protein MPSEU_000080800 [Mayamaea pseudoterrestris]|nr:hypothetical protein MPSEU_000080800 [Mayamaea pseudoterrestris]